MAPSDLVVAVISVTVVTQVYVSSQETTFRSVKECNYLESTAGQDNAYINGKGEICCLCSKGTKWKDDCNPSHPNTTVCKACHWDKHNIDDRYFVNYEPHRLKECILVTMKKCLSSLMIYKEGSVTEKPSCVCPPGMIKNGRHDCELEPTKPALDSSTPETTSQSNQVTTTSTQGTNITEQAVTHEQTITSKQQKTTSKRQETDYGANITQQTVTHEQTITSKRQKTTFKDQETHNGIYTAVGVVVLIGAIAIVSHKYKLCCYAMEPLLSPNISPDSSCQKLTCGSNSNQDVFTNQVYYEAADNNATLIVARSNRMHQDGGDEESAQTAPLLSNEGVETREQTQTLRNEVPLQAPLQLSAPQIDPVPEEKDFAIEVAKELGVVMKKEDAKQIFRHYASSPRCENKLEEIMQKGENSVNTYIAFMSWLKNKIGKELTPEYLLEKSKTMDPFYKIIVETIEDKMIEFGIEVPKEANNDGSISVCNGYCDPAPSVS